METGSKRSPEPDGRYESIIAECVRCGVFRSDSQIIAH